MNDIPDKLWQLLTDPDNKEFVDIFLKEVSRRIKEGIRKEEKDRTATIEEIKRAVLESIKQNRELYKLLKKYDK